MRKFTIVLLCVHITGLGEPSASEPLHRGGSVSWSTQIPGEVQDMRTHQCSV